MSCGVCVDLILVLFALVVWLLVIGLFVDVCLLVWVAADWFVMVVCLFVFWVFDLGLSVYLFVVLCCLDYLQGVVLICFGLV